MVEYNAEPPVWEPWSDHPRPQHGSRPAALLPSMADTTPCGLVAFETDLATRSPAHLTDAELVDAAVGLERIAAWAHARQYAVLAEFARRSGDGTIGSGPVPAGQRRQWAADEIAMALHLAPGPAAARLNDAARLDRVLRPTRDLLAAGRLDHSRARLIAAQLATLDDHKATAVQARVLPQAPGQTWSQLRAALRRAILAVDHDGAAERHRTAIKSRRVDLFADDDGMATLWARLSAVDAAASFAWITRLARGLPTTPDNANGSSATCDSATCDGATCDGATCDSANSAGAATDPAAGNGVKTSIDARRADVLVALLTGRLQVLDPDNQPTLTARPVGADRPLVHLTMPLSTVTGAGDEPGELTGYGPIPAHLARGIAADPNSTWRRLLTDPVSGVVLDHGRTTYRPPTGLANLVRARDGSCRHPACRRTATGCELDHVIAWRDGGPTSEANFVALCPRHHLLKEQPGWRVRLHPDRSMEWTTPTGHRYTSRPADHRTPDPPPTDSTDPTPTDPVPLDPASLEPGPFEPDRADSAAADGTFPGGPGVGPGPTASVVPPVASSVPELLRTPSDGRGPSDDPPPF